jgi:sporulation protein YqfC
VKALKKRKPKNEGGGVVAGELEIPRIAMAGEVHIELFSNAEVIIDGCKSIIKCTDTSITLNTGKRAVSVTGDALVIKSFVCEQVVIDGEILSLDFVS